MAPRIAKGVQQPVVPSKPSKAGDAAGKVATPSVEKPAVTEAQTPAAAPKRAKHAAAKDAVETPKAPHKTPAHQKREAADDAHAQRGLADRQSSKDSGLFETLDPAEKEAAPAAAPKAAAPTLASLVKDAGAQISGREMQAMLGVSGKSAEAMTDEFLAGKGPFVGKMTLDSLATLVNAMDPSKIKTKAEGQKHVERLEHLQKLTDAKTLPAYDTEDGPPAAIANGDAQTKSTPAADAAATAAMLGQVSAASADSLAMPVMGGTNLAFQGAPVGEGQSSFARDSLAHQAFSAGATYTTREQEVMKNMKPEDRAMYQMQKEEQLYNRMITLMTQLLQMAHETTKAIIQNLRA